MSYSPKKQMFREFSVVDQRYTKKNYLKNLRNSFQEFCKKKDIFPKELNFMLWAYDLDFFTIKYASQNYKMDKKRMGDHIVYPLMKEKYIYKVYDKLTPSQSMEDHLFRDETKYNYRVRYSLTKKARILVQAFYDYLEGYS